jgi:Na+-transporting NADH:ubiquinone oxidoreductase subunit D
MPQRSSPMTVPGDGGAAFKAGILGRNPILFQVLGICSALAVTSRLDTALVMSAGLVFVATASCGAVSAIRRWTPYEVRLIAQVLIIATLVIVVDLFLKAQAYELSKALGPYVGLIITNCVIMGRCEAFASRHRPVAAMLDGAGNALGYGLVLVVIASVREPLGGGTLLNFQVIPGNEPPCRLMAMAPGAFLAMGVLVWIVRAVRPLDAALGVKQKESDAER